MSNFANLDAALVVVATKSSFKSLFVVIMTVIPCI